MFYYLLAGASEDERKSFHLLKPEEYHYLNQVTSTVCCVCCKCLQLKEISQFTHLLRNVSEIKRTKIKNPLSSSSPHNMAHNPWQHKELSDAEAVAGDLCCHGDSPHHRCR